ncbi:MAG TPA: porin [Rhizomicrobium sp.]|nr:porin [Rhizomicrobium sp.]
MLTTVAVVALVASTGAGLAKTKHKPAPAADTTMSSPSSPSSPAMAANGPSNAELAARIDSLQAELAAAEDHRNADHGRLSALEQNFNDTSWTFDNARPTVKSGDGRFTMAFRVRFQSDFAGFMQDTPAPVVAPATLPANRDLSSGAVIRRAYFGVEGKVFNDFNYELRLNGGGTDGGNNGASGVPNGGEGDPLVNKAVLTYVGIPHWHLNVGVIEPAFMFEGTTSSASLMFLERPEIDNIAADTFGAGDSRRGVELGFQHTDLFWSGDNLAVTGAFTGGKTGSTANHGNGGDENTQVLGRISDRLWTDGVQSNFQIGASGAEVLYSGTAAGGATQTLRFRDRPEIRVDGTRLIDTGGINAKTGHMWALDAGGNIDNFFLGGEYASFTMDRQCAGGILTVANAPQCANAAHTAIDGTKVFDHPTSSGFYVEGSWVITGEAKQYSPGAINNEVGGFNAPVPSAPFSFSGGSWGAWELAVRYSDTDLDFHDTQVSSTSLLPGINGGDEKIIAIALNWYLNRNIRVMLDDNIVHVQKGGVGTTAAVLNHDNQDLNIVGIRVQFAN